MLITSHCITVSAVCFHVCPFPPNMRLLTCTCYSLCVSRLPQATDETLLDKLKQQHPGDSFFVPSPNAELKFVIQHYAGRVEYNIKV